MESIAAWLAGTAASDVIQKTFWIIPVMQTIHIICVAMVFSSVVMIEFASSASSNPRRSNRPSIAMCRGFSAGVVVLAVTGSVLIIGEPERSLPSYEFQMKMLCLAVALGFTFAFAHSVRRMRRSGRRRGRSSNWRYAGTQGTSRAVVNALAVLAFGLGNGRRLWAVDCLHGRALAAWCGRNSGNQ